MANYLTTDTDLTSVANAIRTKGGTNSTLSFPSGWIDAINNLPSGISTTDAVIHVTVYLGSTVTMTKGNETINPTKLVSASDSDYEIALFIIPPSKFDLQNAWTVTSVGDYTYSGSIIIGSNKDYYMELIKVPVEYQEVEYLTCTDSATQRINIGITPSQVFGGTFAYMTTSDISSSGYVWGASQNTDTVGVNAKSLGLGCGSGAKGLTYLNNVLDCGGYTAGVKYTGSFSCSDGFQSCTVNGNTQTGSTTGTTTSSRNIVIFGFDNNGSQSGVTARFRGNIYYLTFTDENGDLLRDLVPCYRKSDSVGGMWDRVTKTFMSPTTGGALTLGPNVLNYVAGSEYNILDTDNALVHVDAPFGSTITFNSGGVDVATILPEESFTNEDNTSASYYYGMIPTNFGDWIVTATWDNGTASKNITIDTVKQYDLTLNTSTYFIKDGVIQDGFTVTNSNSSSIVITSNYEDLGFTRVYRAKPSGGTTYYVLFSPAHNFELKAYSTLYFDFQIIDIYSNSGNATNIGFGTSTINEAVANWLVSQQYTNTADPVARKTIGVDVSNLVDSEYLKFSFGASSAHTADIRIYNLWLG